MTFILLDITDAESIAAVRDADARAVIDGGVIDPNGDYEGEGWQLEDFYRDPMEYFGPNGTLDRVRPFVRAREARESRVEDSPAPVVGKALAAPVVQVQPSRTVVRAGPKVGANDRCPCGSGKKYKKCHMGRSLP